MVNSIAEIPKISVCIPVYNAEKYIIQAIDSVLHQTFQNFEIVVVDNCSTDNTGELVRQYNDPRINYYCNDTNLGMEKNFNRALELACGEYIKLLCADDYLFPDCLEKQLAVFLDATGNDLVMVCCNRDIVGSDGKRIMTRKFPGRPGFYSGPEMVTKTIRSGTNVIGEPGAVLFRAGFMSQIGQFDGGVPYLIDLDMWIRLLLLGKICVLNDVLCTFRVSDGSTSVVIAGKQYSDFMEFARRYALDDRFNISKVDLFWCKIMAFKNMILRQIFYKIFVKSLS